jgi:zinc protease
VARRRAAAADRGRHPTVRRGVEPKAQTRLVFTGPFEQSRPNRFALTALEDVLDLRLRDRCVRPSAGPTACGRRGAARVPRAEYSVTIAFGSDPDRVEELVRAVFAEIDSVKATGATPARSRR